MNSAIIDEVLVYEQARSRAGIQIYDSSLWEAIRAGRQNVWEGIFRRKSISIDTRKLLIPINIDNYHFVLAVVDIRERIVWLYDPLREESDNLTRAEQIGSVLGNLLRCTFRSKILIGPLQGNAFDCGIFVIAVTIAVSRDEPVTEHTHVDCLHVREQTWNTLLVLWWQYQINNNTDATHRERGVEEPTEGISGLGVIGHHYQASPPAGAITKGKLGLGCNQSNKIKISDMTSSSKLSLRSMSENKHSKNNVKSDNTILRYFNLETRSKSTTKQDNSQLSGSKDSSETCKTNETSNSMTITQDGETAQATQNNVTTWWRRGVKVPSPIARNQGSQRVAHETSGTQSNLIAISRFDQASQKTDAGEPELAQDDDAAQEASKKNAAFTWWTR